MAVSVPVVGSLEAFTLAVAVWVGVAVRVGVLLRVTAGVPVCVRVGIRVGVAGTPGNSVQAKVTMPIITMSTAAVAAFRTRRITITASIALYLGRSGGGATAIVRNSCVWLNCGYGSSNMISLAIWRITCS